MNKCLKCDGDTSNAKFCSRSCSASYNNSIRTHSDETKKKISNALIGHPPTNMTIEGQAKSLAALEKWRKEQFERMMTCDFESLCYDTQRKRIIIEQDNKCNRCKLSEWQGEQIPLEIDHKDGINNNHVRDNMEALCPNCHALTDTWRGRNRTDKLEKPMSITDEQLVEEFIKCGNIRQTLLNVGMAAKGNNYGRVKRALTIRGINYK